LLKEKTSALNNLKIEFKNEYKDLENSHELEIKNINYNYEQKISSLIKTHDNEI